MEPIHFFYPQMACKIHESTTSVTLLSIRGKFRLSLSSLLPIRGFPSKTIPLFLLQASTNATFHPRIGTSRFTLIYLALNSLYTNFAIAIDSKGRTKYIVYEAFCSLGSLFQNGG